MQMVGGGAEHRVHVLLAFEQLAEVHVFRTPEVRRVRGVMPLDHLAHRLPPRHPLEVEALEIEVFGRVGHRDHLGIGLLEQRTQVRPPLAAGADEGDVDLVARRHLAGSPEHVAGHDRQRGRGGGPLFQEAAA